MTDLGTFSVSALLDLERCERRFMLKRLLERSTTLWLPEEDEEELRADSGQLDLRSGAARGLLVHVFLQKRADPLAAPVESEWAAFLTGLGYDPQTAEFASLFAAIRRAGVVPAAWRPELERAELWREWAFLAELVLPGGHRLRLKGRIDAFWRLPDGRVFLLDYKTQVYEAQGVARYAAQLELYAAVLAQLGGAAAPGSQAALGYLLDLERPWHDVAIEAQTLAARLGGIERSLLRLYENDQRALPVWQVAAVRDCPGESCPFAAFCPQTPPSKTACAPKMRRL